MKHLLLKAPTVCLLFCLLFVFNISFAQPTITSFTPVTGPVGTLVTIKGTNLNSSTAFIIAGVSAITVSNDGNTLVGMVMPGATSGVITISNAGGSVNSSNVFTVTAVPPPPRLQQGNKLVGTGAPRPANQGYAVSLSADGNTALVGGISDSSGVGAAWIYTRAGGVWTQQGNKLVGTGAAFSSDQGHSVCLSADGNTAIVGGSGDNYGAGAAWVFSRSNGVWTQQGNKLVGTGTDTAVVHTVQQGWSVSLSADGNTAIVGGNIDNAGIGAAWVYTRSGGVWTQQGSKLVGKGWIANPYQGYSVALSGDGNTAMVGGYYDNNGIGAVWVYTRNGGVWTQQGEKLVGSGAAGTSGQGSSISLSADGNTAMVGALGDNALKGAAWVFTRSGGVWAQQGGKLVGTGAVGSAYQGFSVSISADGNNAIVGGLYDNFSSGAAWLYARNGNVWSQQGDKIVGTGAIGASYQGRTVAISANGSTAMVGGSSDNTNIGAAWVYVSPAPATGLNFDGMDDRVQLPSPVVGNLPNFTAEAWVKWDGINNGVIYAEGKAGEKNPLFSFGPTKSPANGNLEIILKNGSGVGLDKQATKGVIPVNVWTHVALVRNTATTAILYINGNPTDSMTFADPGTLALDVANIGVRQSVGSDGFFGGSMDEFRLWNRALCQEEIQHNMNADINATAQSGLVAAYHFDNGFVETNNTGLNTAADATGNGNDGTLVNFTLTGSTSNWVAGTVTGTAPIYIPSEISAAAGGDTLTQTEIINTAGTYYIDNTCGLIAKVVPSGNIPVGGSIRVKVSFDTSVQVYNNSPYVRRHYDIEPATNAANATATVTLYFTQKDFDAYNAVKGGLPALPTGPSDALGIANLRITQFHGFGLEPGNYNGNAVLIDPADANIIWNAVNSRWEVTFDVTGFSGFYVHTSIGNGALPLTLLNFSGTNNGLINHLEWTTTSEQNSSLFELERSRDGNNFIKAAIIPAQDTSSRNTSYSYNDDITGISSPAYFYRLKMVDVDGRFTYSAVIKIRVRDRSFTLDVSPNPFNRKLQVNISSLLQQQATISLTDITGKLLFKTNYLIQKGSNVLLLPQADNLPQGMYFLRLQTATQQENIKVIKQ